MNIVQLPQGRVFGLEGAGIVRRVGPQVKTLSVGDRVAVVEHGMFATVVTTLEILCIKLPDDLSFNEACTMVFPYITAMHSLMDVGGLEKGQVREFSVPSMLFAEEELTKLVCTYPQCMWWSWSGSDPTRSNDRSRYICNRWHGTESTAPNGDI
jgi:hypothetical protein